MEITLTNMVQVFTISGILFGAVCTVFKYAVISPLQKSIEALSKTIEKLQASVDEEKNMRHELELYIVKVDDRAKSLQHRVDRLEEVVKT